MIFLFYSKALFNFLPLKESGKIFILNLNPYFSDMISSALS